MIYIDVSGGNVYETYIETKKSEEFSSLVYNWKSEFEKFAPTLNVSMVVGTAENIRY